MKNVKHLLSTICMVYCFSGCRHDVDELLNPQANCDTTGVRYSTTIVTILQNNCNRCHAGNTVTVPFKLDTYDAIKLRVADGKLLGAVSHDPGYSPMPKDSPKLSPCDLARIKKWIADGYPNN